MVARLLRGVHIKAFDHAAGCRATDVLDAAAVPLTADGDQILTADVHDLAALGRAADLHVEIVPVGSTRYAISI
jgi:hypothetical protein